MKSLKLIGIIAAGVILAVVVMIAGCTALVAGGTAAVQHESDKTAITPEQFRSIDRGTSRADVERTLGDPSDVQETDVSVFETSSSFDCIYYNEKGELLTLYQFCFENDTLMSKASY